MLSMEKRKPWIGKHSKIDILRRLENEMLGKLTQCKTKIGPPKGSKPFSSLRWKMEIARIALAECLHRHLTHIDDIGRKKGPPQHSWCDSYHVQPTIAYKIQSKGTRQEPFLPQTAIPVQQPAIVTSATENHSSVPPTPHAMPVYLRAKESGQHSSTDRISPIKQAVHQPAPSGSDTEGGKGRELVSVCGLISVTFTN